MLKYYTKYRTYLLTIYESQFTFMYFPPSNTLSNLTFKRNHQTSLTEMILNIIIQWCQSAWEEKHSKQLWTLLGLGSNVNISVKLVIDRPMINIARDQVLICRSQNSKDCAQDGLRIRCSVIMSSHRQRLSCI